MGRSGTKRSRDSRGPGQRLWPSLVVALVLLACYWLTLAPTVGEGDAGELATAVHVMGVPHPTGYPLYLMLGKLFDLLPLGEPAHRIAFFSAVASAAAGALLCWIVIGLTSSAVAGVLGGLTLGLNSAVWGQSNIVELYALHVLLVCVVVMVFARWSAQPSPRRLYQLALVSGLALTHHRTSLFFIAPVLLWAVAATRPISARLLGRTALCAFLPLLLYLWLPFRSAAHPAVNWSNVSYSFGTLLAHISGSQYGELAFRDTAAHALQQSTLEAARLWHQLTPIGLALVLAGVLGMMRSAHQRPLGISLVLSFILTTAWAAFYPVRDRYVYFVPGWIAIAIWYGVGVSQLVQSVSRLRGWARLPRLAPALALVVAAVVPLSMAPKNWHEVDRSQQYDALDLIASAISGAPANAVVLSCVEDETYGIPLYYYYALNHRPLPRVLSLALIIASESGQACLEPGMREALKNAVPGDPRRRMGRGIRAVCEQLDLEQPVYVDVFPEETPRGRVVLSDSPMSRIVAAPGLPQARDSAASRELVSFPGGAGGLLQVSLPAEVTRGQPFAITAAIRWAARSSPQGDLAILFERSELAAPERSPTDENAEQKLGMSRSVPLLFGVSLPPSRPGYHYEQTFNCFIGRRLSAGAYSVFVQLRKPGVETPPALVGSVYVR